MGEVNIRFMDRAIDDLGAGTPVRKYLGHRLPALYFHLIGYPSPPEPLAATRRPSSSRTPRVMSPPPLPRPPVSQEPWCSQDTTNVSNEYSRPRSGHHRPLNPSSSPSLSSSPSPSPSSQPVSSRRRPLSPSSSSRPVIVTAAFIVVRNRQVDEHPPRAKAQPGDVAVLVTVLEHPPGRQSTSSPCAVGDAMPRPEDFARLSTSRTRSTHPHYQQNPTNGTMEPGPRKPRRRCRR